MNKTLSFLASAGIGATGMYLFDPQRGRTRRAFLREKLTSYARGAADTLGDLAQEVGYRAYGTVMELRYQLDRGIPSDRVLEARVKSKLGRVVAHPGSVNATATDGRVTLSGPILADEVDRALMAVRLIPGVTGVVNQFDIHPTPDSIPGLQTGQSTPAGAQG
jgi:osmotically-inducible protein OsmY